MTGYDKIRAIKTIMPDNFEHYDKVMLCLEEAYIEDDREADETLHKMYEIYLIKWDELDWVQKIDDLITGGLEVYMGEGYGY